MLRLNCLSTNMGEYQKVRTIARQLGISRKTVQRYIHAGAFPEMSTSRKCASILDPYMAYLERRWAAGCHNGVQLYREIQEQGFTGSRSLLSRWVASHREQKPNPICSDETQGESNKTVKRPWSARHAVWLLLRQPEELSLDRKAALSRVLAASPVVQTAYSFAQAFVRIIRDRLSLALEPWIRAVSEYKTPGLRNFAEGLKHDQTAVLAALSLPWSNGQVEGQVNRLKLIKRQMYGRANFDLLRLRVLAR